MKKAIISLITLAIIAFGGSYAYAASKENNQNFNSNSNGTVITQNNNSTNNSQQNNSSINNSNQNANTTNNLQSSPVSNSTSKNNLDTNNNTIAHNTGSNSTNSTNITPFTVSSNFTNDQLNTIYNICKSESYFFGSGSATLIINPDYYSIVNGEKYYAIFNNTIPETNYFMAGVPPFPNKSDNFSQENFIGFMNKYGNKISFNEFLNGQVSFNPNTPNNLTSNDISNMLRKIAITYADSTCISGTNNNILNNNLNNFTKNITINLSNTKIINGETYYEVEYEPNEPFYISLTGRIYVAQEHYLAPIFPVPSATNAQVYKAEQGA